MTLNFTPPCSVFSVALSLQAGQLGASAPAENASNALIELWPVDEGLVGEVKPGPGEVARAETLLVAREKAQEKTVRSRTVREGSAYEVVSVFAKDGAGALERLRKAMGVIFDDWESLNVTHGVLRLELASCKKLALEIPEICYTLAETACFILYHFEREFLGQALKPNKRKLRTVDFVLEGQDLLCDGTVRAFELGISNGLSFQKAREWGDCPANLLTPHILTTEVAARLIELGVKCTVLDEHALAAQGFGGLIAVGKGSANPPRLAVLEYTPREDGQQFETVALVGKGVTFDTGGYSIKPKMHHNEMKFDMCGAANVAAAFECLVRAKVKVKLVGLLACAENMVSANAQRPGDVYRAYNGSTIDVFNTDAEGRLVLADALSYAEKFSPQLIIDMATLTGGTTQIAGSMAAIVCTNKDEMLPLLKAASRFSGERFLHLEIFSDAIEDMKGAVSDYANMNTKWGTGAMTMYAAAFLQEFVPKGVPWLHLDIANMAWALKSNGYIRGSGANAYGARTLYHLLCYRYGCTEG